MLLTFDSKSLFDRGPSGNGIVTRQKVYRTIIEMNKGSENLNNGWYMTTSLILDIDINVPPQ